MKIRIETSKTEQTKKVLQGLGLDYRLSVDQIRVRLSGMKYPNLRYDNPPAKELIDSAIEFVLQRSNYFTVNGSKIEIEVDVKNRGRVLEALKGLGIEIKTRNTTLTTLTEELQERLRKGLEDENVQAELKRLGKSSRHYYTVAYEVLDQMGYRFNPALHPASLEQSKWSEVYKEAGDRRTLKSNLDLLESSDTDKLGTLIEGILYSVHSEN